MHAHFTQVEWGPIYLAAGVTTARDCANEFEFITAARDAIAARRGLGPRLLPAGIIDGEGPITIGVDIATTSEQAVALVRRYADAGFPQIKIYSSLKPELVADIAREAHRLGLSVTGHIPRGMNVRRAIESGMDQINHITTIVNDMITIEPDASKKKSASFDRAALLRQIDPGSERARQFIGFLKEQGTVIDPTIALYELTRHPPGRVPEPGLAKVAPELAGPLRSMGVPPAMEQRADESFRKLVEWVGALHKAGVPIVAGTDQAVPGHSLHRELELYVQAGMTPMEAIQSATIGPAPCDEARSPSGDHHGWQAGRPHTRSGPARPRDLRHPQGKDRDRGRPRVRLCGALEKRRLPALIVRSRRRECRERENIEGRSGPDLETPETWPQGQAAKSGMVAPELLKESNS